MTARSYLPPGWALASVGEISSFNPKNEADDQTPCGFATMHGLGTKYHERLRFEERPWGVVKKAYTHFQNSDVLVAKVTPCFENGKAGIARDLPGGLGAGSSEFCVFRPARGIDNRYLLGWLSTDDFRRRATIAMTGSVGLKRVPKEIFLSEQIPLAPSKEQKRIADKLDAVLTRVDAVSTRLARVAPILKSFRQSVLAAATSGRLTEDWRDINRPTSAQAKGQLDTITQSRFQRMKKAKEAVERTNSEEFEIPNSWLWTSLDALTAKIVDGTHHTPTYVGEGVPFVSVKDIRDGVIDFSSTKFIAEVEHRELSKRCLVERGDLLITKSGTIGRTALVKTDIPFSLFVSVALLKPASSAVNMRFIDLVLRHWVGSIDISSRIVGSTIKNLHLVDMKVLGIPFPCLDEQAEIVRRVETLFAFADRLEARLKAAQTATERLTPALLAKAFRGELVPQDPNDEPASELLRRLQAAAPAGAAGRGRKRSI